METLRKSIGTPLFLTKNFKKNLSLDESTQDCICVLDDGKYHLVFGINASPADLIVDYKNYMSDELGAKKHGDGKWLLKGNSLQITQKEGGETLDIQKLQKIIPNSLIVNADTLCIQLNLRQIIMFQDFM